MSIDDIWRGVDWLSRCWATAAAKWVHFVTIHVDLFIWTISLGFDANVVSWRRCKASIISPWRPPKLPTSASSWRRSCSSFGSRLAQKTRLVAPSATRCEMVDLPWMKVRIVRCKCAYAEPLRTCRPLPVLLQLWQRKRQRKRQRNHWPKSSSSSLTTTVSSTSLSRRASERKNRDAMELRCCFYRPQQQHQHQDIDLSTRWMESFEWGSATKTTLMNIVFSYSYRNPPKLPLFSLKLTK